MRLRDRFARFMYGRYGTDDLNRALLIVALICMFVSLFTHGGFHTLVYWLSVIILIICYARTFSRNISKRYQENQLFLQKTANIRRWLASRASIASQKKTHHIYKCPTCKQKIRIPKGKGRIEITCPKCRAKFIKNS